MAEIVHFRCEDGSVILVELTQPALAAPESDVGLVVKEGEGGVREAATRLEDSLGSVEGAAVALMGAVKALREREDSVLLDEVSLELSLSFGVEGGVVVAKGKPSAEAAVTLTWRAPKSG